MITYKFIVCGTDNKTNLGHLSVSNTPFKNFFKKKSMYVMHARMHACCKRGYLVFYFFFFFHEQRKRREREKKKGKGYKESNEIFPLLRHLWMG